MLLIRKANICRYVDRYEFDKKWKADGYEIVQFEQTYEEPIEQQESDDTGYEPSIETDIEEANIDVLREEAKELGFKPPPNMKPENLKRRIEEIKAETNK